MNSALSVLNDLSSLSIETIEEELLSMPQVDCPVVHHFGPGLYIRELAMKAGTLAVGHRQRFSHMNIVLQGKVAMLQADGSVKEICAPTMFVGEPGRKVGWVLEDVVWQNIYATELTDIEELETYFLDKSEGWLKSPIQALLGYIDQRGIDEFNAMVQELGFSPELVRTQSENTLDQIPMPMGSWRFKVSDSKIEGKGIFATADMVEGDVVGPARRNGFRTPLGRFTNHSDEPNAAMIRVMDDEIVLVALGDIRGCKGGQNGDEITIDYRQALTLSKTQRNLS